jgi:hypothetical protein
MNPLTGKVERRGTFGGYEVAGWRHSDHPSWKVKVWLAGCPRDWFGYTVTAGMFEFKMSAHAQGEAVLHAIGAWEADLADPKTLNEALDHSRSTPISASCDFERRLGGLADTT